MVEIRKYFFCFSYHEKLYSLTKLAFKNNLFQPNEPGEKWNFPSQYSKYKYQLTRDQKERTMWNGYCYGYGYWLWTKHSICTNFSKWKMKQVKKQKFQIVSFLYAVKSYPY